MENYPNYDSVFAKHIIVTRVGEEETPTLPLEAETELAAQLGLKRSDLHEAALQAGIVPRRYLRNIGTIGIKGQLKLFQSKVAVIGCGGLGGHAVELLARIGVGTLILIDEDVFEDSNLNRQLLCTEADLGKPKVMVACERVEAVNSAVEVYCFQQRLTRENARAMLRGANLVLDALDNFPSRFVLEQAARELAIPLVHGAIGGFWGQVMTIYPDDVGLRQIYGDPGQREGGVELQAGTPSTTPALVAALQVQEAVKCLTGIGKPQRRQLLHIDAIDGVTSKLKFTTALPISFVGSSESGKTSLMAAVIRQLAGGGLKVAAVKHGHASEDLDKEGTDSWRYRAAGADSTAFIAGHQTAIFHQMSSREAGNRLWQWFPAADIILLEGYKTSLFPKILVHREGVSERLSPWPPNIIAIAGDVEAARKIGLPKNLPGFGWDETEALINFVLQQWGSGMVQ